MVMGDLIDIERFRERKHRREVAREAELRRRTRILTPAERDRIARQRELSARRLEGHRLEGPPSDD